jgi:hypothetical protein
MRRLRVLIVIGTALFLMSCAGRSSTSGIGPEQLPLGLYEVTKRDCSYPPNIPEDCSQTQYLELVKGAFRTFDKNEVAFATWLSDSSEQVFTFNVRDLTHGRWTDAHEFLIEDDSFGKEWFVIRNGEITEYFFLRYPRKSPVGDMAGKTHLFLKRIYRTDKINRMLHYPSSSDLQ